MLRILFLAILAIHGLIHVMGFFKAFQLAKIEQLALPISRPFGVIWLLATLLFVGVFFCYLWKVEWWWSLAWVAVLVSQGLILCFWSDAKFGTIANILVLVPSLVGFQDWNFHRNVQREVRALIPMTSVQTEPLTEEKIKHLPAVVKKWLVRSNAIGKPMVKTAFLEQKGQMKTSPKGGWMPFAAQQWVTTETPGFLWETTVNAAPGVHLTGRDRFFKGQGHMLIKLLSTYAVADEKGEKIDQGTLLRFLGEMVWYPSAAIAPYLRWEEINPTQAKVTMTDAGKTVSGVFTFTADGDFSSFQAKRYYSQKGTATLEDWLIQVEPNGYQTFEGIRVPQRVRVIWKLKHEAGGDFWWYSVNITQIQYNKTP